MIEHSKYVPRQMNGKVLNAFFMALEDEFKDAKEIENYLYHLSLDTAQEDELETIGDIIGYVRPIMPKGLGEDWFLFGNAPIQEDPEIGFSEIDTTIGGKFYSVSYGEDIADDNYMGVAMYRIFLSKIAFLKRYGMTLKAVDMIASFISNNYTIGYDSSYIFVEITAGSADAVIPDGASVTYNGFSYTYDGDGYDYTIEAGHTDTLQLFCTVTGGVDFPAGVVTQFDTPVSNITSMTNTAAVGGWDLVITYGRSIGYKNVWTLTNIFYRIATIPQVQINSITVQ